MQITEQQLLQILPNARRNAGVFVSAINRAAARYDITSRVRLAAFLAQAGHESAELTRLVENLNYGAAGLANTWPGRFAVDPTARQRVPNGLALRLERQPEAIANAVYGNRMGNGPAASGDGWRYRGRGCSRSPVARSTSGAVTPWALPWWSSPSCSSGQSMRRCRQRGSGRMPS